MTLGLHRRWYKMTSRINYNAPLKSVRTIRALQLEQCDPPAFIADDPARLSDADLLNRAGVAFVWENAPGCSKVEPEKPDPGVLGTRNVKPPPHQMLAPPPFLKTAAPDVLKSPPPAGSPALSGTNFENQGNLFVGNRESTTQSMAEVQATTKCQSKTSPPRPPSRPNRNRAPVPVNILLQLGNDNSASLSNGDTSASVSKQIILDARPLSPAEALHQRAAGTKGEEFMFLTAHKLNPVLSSTLQPLETGEEATRNVKDQGLSNALADDDGRGPLSLSALNQRRQDYLTEGLDHGPARLVKDFYMSGRHTGSSTLLGSAFSTLPNSCFPTRPNGASASETGSQSDEGERTDVGDESSRMNMNSRDLDPHCQVSIFDGDQHEAARHTDPHARDFIMERFLPAAKAMVTESDSSDRRSHRRENATVPTSSKTRPLPRGRSRFAFQDRFPENGEGTEDINPSDEPANIKFLRREGTLDNIVVALKNTPGSWSVDQSPSPSLGNECSPSLGVSFVNQTGSSPALSHNGHHDGPWLYAESDGSNTTKDDNIAQSFEDRGFPSYPANVKGLFIQTTRTKDGTQHFHQRRESGSGEPSPADHKGLELRKDMDKDKDKHRSVAFFLGVPKDRLEERATRGSSSRGVVINADTAARSPEMLLAGSLGALLKSAQERDNSRSPAGISASAERSNVVGSVNPVPPASILNHSRYIASRAAAAPVAAGNASANNGLRPATIPNHTANGVRYEDDRSCLSQQKGTVIRQQASESSRNLMSPEIHSNRKGGVHQSSAAKSRSPTSKDDNQSVIGKVFTSSTINILAKQSDKMSTPGWPLGKAHIPYVQTPSPDSKDASFSSASNQSLWSVSNQGFATHDSASSDKFSPISVLQPPLPKSPAESWLCKVRQPLPPPKAGSLHGEKQKKTLEYSFTDDSMDLKWEVLVKSDNAQRRNKIVQEHQKGSVLSAFERDILG